MTTRQYIGARYIPIFADPVEWTDERAYEALMMVQHLGETYMTKQAVPVGVQLPDTSQGEESNEFWVHMTNWNAQVETYRQEVLQYNSRISTLENDLPISSFDATNTVKKYIDDADSALNLLIETLENALPISDFDSTNTVKKYLNEINQTIENIENYLDSNYWVTTNKIANNSVSSEKITSSAIINSKLANNAVSESKISDSSVTSSKLASNSVTTNKLSDGSVSSSKIANGSITTSHLSAGLYDSLAALASSGQPVFVNSTSDMTDTSKFYLIKNGNGHIYAYISGSWTDTGVSYSGSSNFVQYGTQASGSDLDNMVNPGMYYISANNSYTHAPVDGLSLTLVVFKPQTGSNAGVIQYAFLDYGQSGGEGMGYNYGGTTVYTRCFINNYWSSWSPGKSSLYMQANSNLNDFITEASYYTQATVAPTVTNTPVSDGAYVLSVIKPLYNHETTGIIQIAFILSGEKTNSVFTRHYYGAAWSNWFDIAAKVNIENDIVVTDYVELASSDTLQNEGINLTLMDYNICYFSNDTSTYIPQSKFNNLKQMFMRYNADIIGIQEDYEYIDGVSMSSDAYLYYPKYPNKAASTGIRPSIRSKKEIASSELLTLQTAGINPVTGYVRHAIINLPDSKTLSVYSAHAFPGETTTAYENRKQDWQELANILDNDANDYVIMFGDFNTHVDDADTFENIFADYQKVNGGYIDWFETTGRYNPQLVSDNILFKGNIVINRIEVLTDWYNLLYSDHIPIICDITLS